MGASLRCDRGSATASEPRPPGSGGAIVQLNRGLGIVTADRVNEDKVNPDKVSEDKKGVST